MKPASRFSDLARISDLAQLLDSRALLTSLRESRWEALKDISRRATLKALIDTVLGRRGPRRVYLMSLLRRMTALAGAPGSLQRSMVVFSISPSDHFFFGRRNISETTKNRRQPQPGQIRGRPIASVRADL